MLTRIRRAIATLAVAALAGAGVLATVESAVAAEPLVTLDLAVTPESPTPKDEVTISVDLRAAGENSCKEAPGLTLSVDRTRSELREAKQTETGWHYETVLAPLEVGRHRITVTAAEGCAISGEDATPVTARRSITVAEAKPADEKPTEEPSDTTEYVLSGTAYRSAEEDPKDVTGVRDVKVELVAVEDGETIARTTTSKSGRYDLVAALTPKDAERDYLLRFSYPSGEVVYFSEKAEPGSSSPSEPKAATHSVPKSWAERSFDAYAVTAEGAEPERPETVEFAIAGTTYQSSEKDPKDIGPARGVKVELLSSDGETIAGTESDHKSGAYVLTAALTEKDAELDYLLRFSYPSGTVVYFSEKTEPGTSSPEEPQAATHTAAKSWAERSFDAYVVIAIEKDSEPEPGDEPSSDQPAGDEPAGDEPAGDETPAEETPADETPADENPTEDTPAETPADEAPADDKPLDKDPVDDETPSDKTPAEETPAEETPTDETPADETPADETPAEDETPVEERPSADDTDPTLSLLLELAIGEKVEGADVGLDASGLATGGSWNVVVHSTPHTIGSGTVGPTGVVSTTLALPGGLEAGWHSITFTGTLATGGTTTTVLWFRVDGSGHLLTLSLSAPADATSGGGASTSATLAATGSTLDGSAGASALLLVVAGLALLIVSQRRRATASTMNG